MSFLPAVAPRREPGGPAWWLAFSGERLLARLAPSSATVPLLTDGLEAFGLHPVRTQFLGWLDQRPCFSAELPDDTVPPEGWTFQGLRRLFGVLEDDLYSVAVRAKQIVFWDRTHQYCGQCGISTLSMEDERARTCPSCGLASFPRLSPAVIVAVTRGDELLLARAQRFPQGFYSVLAGYVEPGETLEECVAREVREEVGIEVRNIRYFGSQSWPFPHSLMVAFTAEHAGGDIRPDPTEIADAGWFKRDGLPWIPEKISIARRLIDWFVEAGE
ncbi:MAG: NAD(+) diphosphatase [Syntrophobacteraceae bacterium]|nr:NAD(+) diphosphatase [Syntrophobacteraceae bacterium]